MSGLQEESNGGNWDAVIISGGSVDEALAREELASSPEAAVFCADRGAEFFRRNGLVPDIAVGDFDSISGETMHWLAGTAGEIIRLKCEKDDSDTQAAMELAIEKGARRILILGATGTRLDHVYGNISLLLLARKKGCQAFLQDTFNRLSMPSSPAVLTLETCYGSSVSFFPWGGPVTGLTLEGFRYPLKDRTLTAEDYSLTVSNELAAPRAVITYRTGNLLMIEAREQ